MFYKPRYAGKPSERIDKIFIRLNDIFHQLNYYAHKQMCSRSDTDCKNKGRKMLSSFTFFCSSVPELEHIRSFQLSDFVYQNIKFLPKIVWASGNKFQAFENNSTIPEKMVHLWKKMGKI